MAEPLSRQHLGILLTIAGSVLLAFSVRVKRQYTGPMAKVVDNLKQQDHELVEPTEASIVRPLFWAGLSFIAAGSLLQW